ncbi:hypothetical protein Misp01_49890 [Microtetraspora sp. NBRC 13810]|nr:hypothetical protein Misp01_49890 [Microtetraspora sp. NBRC 13810]
MDTGSNEQKRRYRQNAANGTPIREVVGKTLWGSPRRFFATTRLVSGGNG